MKDALSFILILLLALLDQWSKALVLRYIPLQEDEPIIPGFFSLTHLHNTGAAFGMLHDSNTFFVVLSMLAFVILLVLKKSFDAPFMQAGWILLMAGIIGNVSDRLRLGHVVDFLDFQIGSYHWPSFNVADSCICIAAVLFLIGSFQSPQFPVKHD